MRHVSRGAVAYAAWPSRASLTSAPGYYPELAPLKQGVARIVSSVLTNQKDTPGFELAVQTCSITYLHRNLFRSDVLVTFHPPLVLSPTRNVDLLEGDAHSSTSYDAVRKLTTEIGDKIRSGTLDAPSTLSPML